MQRVIISLDVAMHGHGCYFIIPPSTATVNLFHYVATSVHVLAVCTCMLLRSGFISSSAWVSLRPEIKLGALRAQSLVFHSTQAGCHSGTAAAETDEACRVRLIARNMAKWQEIAHVWVLCACIFKCECLLYVRFAIQFLQKIVVWGD